MKKFTVTLNQTLKAFTDSTYPQGSFAFNALLKKGDIKVNGVRQRADCPVFAGDEVIYYTTAVQEQKTSHLTVYEDENVYVADKLSGVSSEGLFYELKDRAPFPVHRLDRNTSGLVVLAKSAAVQEKLVEAFRQREVEKVYLCLAKNAFKRQKAELCAYLSKDEKTSLVRIYPTANVGRVEIKTDYEVLKTYGDYALVKVILHTGKTHQIRAHLSYIGCPVLGDTKYGDFALNKKYSATRQILVAKYLKFNLSGSLSYLNEVRLESSFIPKLPKDEQ
ncbi:MAG: RluA family pseudouridine synthase [Candidatus Coproplasma sp.]